MPQCHGWQGAAMCQDVQYAVMPWMARTIRDERRYDSTEGIGTTTRTWEVELRREQQPRAESGTEAESNALGQEARN